jgi:two-component system response regulator AlgR
VNRPLSVFIVDDEAPARERLRQLLEDCAEALPVRLAGEAGNGREALERLAVTPTDVVLTDIRMPGMDGIELARHLQRLPHPPAVVFTTAYDSYAIQAFELHAVDYLLKPIRAARLLESLRRIPGEAGPDDATLRQMQPAPRRHLSIHERNQIQLVPLDDILYLRAEMKYVTVRTAAREYLTEEPLAALEQEFPQRFLRIHRNCLVARAAICGMERVPGEGEDAHWVVKLDGTYETLPVSRRQLQMVKEALG